MLPPHSSALSLLLFASSLLSAAEATTQAKVKEPSQFSAQASIVHLSRMSLSNQIVEVPYSALSHGVAMFQFSLGQRIATIGQLQIFGEGRVGYSHAHVPLSVLTSTGPVEDRIHLYWVPLSVAVRAQYHIPGFDAVTPSLTIGGSMNWLSQSGSVPGTRQSHWIPTINISPGISFLARRKLDDWFGGFTFGTTFYTAVSSPQKMQGLSIDLRFNCWL